ncbi:MAG TPA: peptidoglycan-associated lipoprotein Pal [Candidatus Acidoferrum sp.]|jgi:peptidoglycan-associated lipoprotein|nr:peptidoglycan-associated lipoprotein Pal [Candidatus Acidoferrum sp.]
MREKSLKSAATVVALTAVLMLGACHKKTAPPPPPPPPPAPSPTASISVSPDTIQKGQSATLTWQTSNATDVSIDGIGAVQPSGSQQVTPADSATYHLVAKGTGGTQEASTRLTVTQPPPPPPPPPAPSATEADLFGQDIRDVYFDYDKSAIRADQQASLQADAQFLNQHSSINFTIEGHCDERGSTEYNLALGDQRASAVKNALVAAGISASRIKTISYGKEKPFCSESNEACWQQNRRGHFVYQR